MRCYDYFVGFLMSNRYCLVDEPWIPIAGAGKVSLLDVFSNPEYSDIDGTPIQKIALTKLFIAIAQSAISIKDEDEWKRVGSQGVADAVISYLKENRECFFLYGDKPFLQVPEVLSLKDAAPKEIFYTFLPDLASENDTILKETQNIQSISDAERTLFIITLMNYALGGKRVSSSKPIAENYQKKSRSAKAAPSIGGAFGYLQTCLKGSGIIETVWLNFFTESDMHSLKVRNPDARPPWERMPSSEDDERAREIAGSVFAWLVSVSRFVYLQDSKVIYVEGIQYPSSVKDGYWEPFITIRKKDNGVIYADPSKKPWRSISAFLEAVYVDDSIHECMVLSQFLNRTRGAVDIFSIWSGGLKARANSGDQSVKQSDDFVESEVSFYSQSMGTGFYHRLCKIIEATESIAKTLRVCISRYFKAMKCDGNAIADNAVMDFWVYADSLSSSIIYVAYEENEADVRKSPALSNLRRKSLEIYDNVCSHETARQIVCWVNNRPDSRRNNEQ